MKKLILILFLFIPILNYGQSSVKYRQATLDTLRLKNLLVVPDSILGFGTVYALGDSVWFKDQNNTNYNLIRWLDSIAQHRTELDAHLDSIVKERGWYYTLRDSVRGLISDTANLLHWADTVGVIATHSMLDSLTTSLYDSIQRHTDNYYTLQDSVIQNIADIAAIEAGENHIENNTYFTGETAGGDTVNLWQINAENLLRRGVPELIASGNTEPDARLWWNIPLINALYGDTVGYVRRIGNYIVAQTWGIADGGGGLVSRGHKLWGNVYATQGLFVRDSAVLVKELDPHYAADSAGIFERLGDIEDDTANFLLRDGSRSLTSDWNAGRKVTFGDVVVNDTIYTAYFKMATGASNGYVLKTDANGNASWQMQTSAYKGTWNANTNTPTLADATGTNGDFYIVATGDTIDLGSGNKIFVTGGTAIHNGSVWEPVNPSQVVTSVNSLIGDVQLDLSIDGDTIYITGGADVDASTLTSIVNIMDSITNHTVRYYLVLDTLTGHWGRLVALERDTASYIQWPDTVVTIATKYDLDTLSFIYDNDLTGIRDTLGSVRDSLAYYAPLAGATFTGKVTVNDTIQAQYGYITERLGVGSIPMSWKFYSAGHARVDSALYVYSKEAGKTAHHMIIDPTDADNMRIVAYDLTGAVFKPVRIGGQAADNGLRVRENSILAMLDSVRLDISGGVRVSSPVISTLATGTAPFTIASTTLNTNLNADLLDGYHASSFALAAGENHIANDTYFTGETGTGDTTNLWSITPQNLFRKGIPELYQSGNANPDGWHWRNIPLDMALYGDSIGYKYRVGNYELWKSYILADGGAGYVKRQTDFRGVVTVADSLLIPLRAYNATTWNNSTRAAGEDAVRDKIESMSSIYALLAGATFTGDVKINDTYKLLLGTDSDMGMYHSSGSNFLYVRESDLLIGNQSTTAEFMKFNYNGGTGYVELFFNGVQVFYTGSGGLYMPTGQRIYNNSLDVFGAAGAAHTYGAVGYAGTSATTAGMFNGSTTQPTNNTRLNYEGFLYATYFDGSLNTNEICSKGTGNISVGTVANAAEYMVFNYNSGTGYLDFRFDGTSVANTASGGFNIASGKHLYNNSSRYFLPTATAGTTKATWDGDDVLGVTRAAVSAYVAANAGSGGSPGGSATEWQYRSGASTFGAIGNTFTASNNPGLKDNADLLFGTDSDMNLTFDGSALRLFWLDTYQVAGFTSSTTVFNDPNTTSSLTLTTNSASLSATAIELSGNTKVVGYIDIAEMSAPATPSSGYGRLYFDTSGNLWYKNDAGNARQVSYSPPAPEPSPMMPSIDYEQIANDWATGLRYSTRMIEFRDKEYRFTEMVYDRGLLVSVSPGKWQRMNLIQKLIYR